jgi:hypothetical protein
LSFINAFCYIDGSQAGKVTLSIYFSDLFNRGQATEIRTGVGNASRGAELVFRENSEIKQRILPATGKE